MARRWVLWGYGSGIGPFCGIEPNCANTLLKTLIDLWMKGRASTSALLFRQNQASAAN
jgi:hypothetical protein